MEYRITWGGNPEDVCFATSGVGRLLDIGVMTREALADPRWRDGLKVLIDHTQSDWDAWTSDELFDLAALFKELGPRFGEQRMAVVFRDRESFRTGRLVGMRLDREVPWLGHAFETLVEARAWLREPSDQILPDVLPRWASHDDPVG